MRRIFLTGPIGCGKSTLIKNTLGENISVASGFVTERVFETGELKGFDIVSLGVRKNLQECSRMRFLTLCGNEIKKNDEAFSVFAARLLDEASERPFVIIDEIGGFELLIPEFMKAFEKFLISKTPCIGVLKSLPSSEKLSKTAELSTEYLKAAKDLHLRLASEPDTEILQTFGRGDENALRKLKCWKEKYA